MKLPETRLPRVPLGYQLGILAAVDLETFRRRRNRKWTGRFRWRLTLESHTTGHHARRDRRGEPSNHWFLLPKLELRPTFAPDAENLRICPCSEWRGPGLPAE